jgi:hypothetical protein
LPSPQTPDQERALVESFLSGLKKLFSRENNWTFLQPLVLSMEHCAHCQTCADACHIFEASGGADIYRPTYRSEVLRRFYSEHVKGGGLISAWQHGRVELMVIAVLLGAFLSGVVSDRLSVFTERPPHVTARRRLVAAVIGGGLFGIGAQFARGCTGGAAPSGMAVMSFGGMLTMVAVFGSAYAVAYFVRRLRSSGSEASDGTARS